MAEYADLVYGLLGVLGFVMFFVFWYFVYRLIYGAYRSGQNKCSVLYPGNSLKALRLRDACEDHKRLPWLGAAAVIALND